MSNELVRPLKEVLRMRSIRMPAVVLPPGKLAI